MECFVVLLKVPDSRLAYRQTASGDGKEYRGEDKERWGQEDKVVEAQDVKRDDASFTTSIDRVLFREISWPL